MSRTSSAWGIAYALVIWLVVGCASSSVSPAATPPGFAPTFSTAGAGVTSTSATSVPTVGQSEANYSFDWYYYTNVYVKKEITERTDRFLRKGSQWRLETEVSGHKIVAVGDVAKSEMVVWTFGSQEAERLVYAQGNERTGDILKYLFDLDVLHLDKASGEDSVDGKRCTLYVSTSGLETKTCWWAELKLPLRFEESSRSGERRLEIRNLVLGQVTDDKLALPSDVKIVDKK